MLTRVLGACALAACAALPSLAAGPAAAPRTAPANACQELDSPGSSLPWCSTAAAATKPEAIDCPSAERWTVLIDNDSLTARANSGNAGAQATSWREMLEWLRKLNSVACRGGANDPLDKLPPSCESIQGLRRGKPLGPCVKGNSLFPRFGGGGSTTPAVEAVNWAADQLRQSRQDMVLVAFDGVVDGNYDERSSPPSEFAGAVAGVVKTGAAAVVARPQGYRYVYILARRPYAAYVEWLAEELAGLWNESPGAEGPAFALPLTGESLLTPGRRTAIAKVQVTGLPLSGNPAWRFGEVPLYRERERAAYWVDPLRWLEQRQPAGVAFRLGWNASPDEWLDEGPVGVAQRPPELHVNHALTRKPPADSSWTEDGKVTIQQLENCAAPTRRTTSLFQDVHATAGHADLLLFRGLQSGLTWLRDWRQSVLPRAAAGRPQPPVDPLCTVGTDAYRRTFNSTERAGVANLALVSPRPVKDPCIVALENGLESSHLWAARESSADKLSGAAGVLACRGERWTSLVASLAATRSRPFPPGSEGFARGTDARVGMETLVLTVAAAAKTTVEEPRASSCILATLRVNDETFRPSTRGPDLQEASSSVANPCPRR